MELHVSSAFFYISLKFLDNSSPNIKKFHPSLEGPMKGPTPMFPKMGPPWKQTPISRALIGISFGVPSKGALLPGSTQWGTTDRDAPFPEPSSIHLSKSPVYEPPFQVPQRGPYGERCQSPYPSFRVHVQCRQIQIPILKDGANLPDTCRQVGIIRWRPIIGTDCRPVTIMELTSEDGAVLLIASENAHLKLKREREAGFMKLIS